MKYKIIQIGLVLSVLSLLIFSQAQPSSGPYPVPGGGGSGGSSLVNSTNLLGSAVVPVTGSFVYETGSYSGLYNTIATLPSAEAFTNGAFYVNDNAIFNGSSTFANAAITTHVLLCAPVTSDPNLVLYQAAGTGADLFDVESNLVIKTWLDSALVWHGNFNGATNIPISALVTNGSTAPVAGQVPTVQANGTIALQAQSGVGSTNVDLVDFPANAAAYPATTANVYQFFYPLAGFNSSAINTSLPKNETNAVGWVGYVDELLFDYQTPSATFMGAGSNLVFTIYTNGVASSITGTFIGGSGNSLSASANYSTNWLIANVFIGPGYSWTLAVSNNAGIPTAAVSLPLMRIRHHYP